MRQFAEVTFDVNKNYINKQTLKQYYIKKINTVNKLTWVIAISDFGTSNIINLTIISELFFLIYISIDSFYSFQPFFTTEYSNYAAQ